MARPVLQAYLVTRVPLELLETMDILVALVPKVPLALLADLAYLVSLAVKVQWDPRVLLVKMVYLDVVVKMDRPDFLAFPEPRERRVCLVFLGAATLDHPARTVFPASMGSPVLKENPDCLVFVAHLGTPSMDFPEPLACLV